MFYKNGEGGGGRGVRNPLPIVDMHEFYVRVCNNYESVLEPLETHCRELEFHLLKNDLQTSACMYNILIKANISNIYLSV